MWGGRGPCRGQRTTRSWFSPPPMWIVGLRLRPSAWGSQLLLAKASHQSFLVWVFILFFEKAQAENFIMPMSVFWTVCALFHLKKRKLYITGCSLQVLRLWPRDIMTPPSNLFVCLFSVLVLGIQPRFCMLGKCSLLSLTHDPYNTSGSHFYSSEACIS